MACKPTLALDRSLRSVDADGHMVVSESRISKANICPYRGSEIPDWERLGLDPNRIYRLFRDPKELEKAASTFDGKPLLIRHVPVTADLPQQDLWVGTLGHCTFEAPYLITRPLTVITAEAQKLIEAEERRELSAGYRYRAEMVPGVYGGEHYDGRMADIHGNHVALVSAGRAGPDVHVADESPTEFQSMKHGKLIARLQKALPVLAGLSTGDLMALDKELGETPEESVVTLDEAEDKAACDEALKAKREKEGEDAELTEEEKEEAREKARDRKAKDKKAEDGISGHKAANDKAARDAKAAHDAAVAADAKEEEDDEKERAADEAEEEEDDGKEDGEANDRRRARDRRAGARDARKAARDKRAKDEEVDHRKDFNSIKQGKDKRAKDKRAHDSMTMDQVNALVEKTVKRATDSTAERVREEVTAKQRALAIACDEVAPLVGKVQLHAFDSAEEVYAFAAEKRGIEVDEDLPKAALRALIRNELRHLDAARKPIRHAMDNRLSGYDPAALFQGTVN